MKERIFARAEYRDVESVEELKSKDVLPAQQQWHYTEPVRFSCDHPAFSRDDE